SFCWPSVLAPTAVMTRPRTGQRNDGAPPIGSATAVSGCAAGSGVAMRAVCGGSTEASLGCGAGGVAGVLKALAVCAATPGITIRSPTLTIVVGGMWFAVAMLPTGLW